MKWGGTSQRMTRWWYNGDTIAPVPPDPVQDVRLPTDGGVSAPGGRLHIMLQMPEISPPEVGLGLIFHQRLISPDVAVDDIDFDRAGYDPQWPWFFGQERTGVGSFPAVTSRYVKLTRRAHVFRPRPHALSTVIYTYTLRWKRDPGLTGPLRMGWLDKGDRMVLFHADGTRETMPERDTTPFRTLWRRGETLVMWTDGRRPAIYFNDGPDLILERDTTWPSGKVGPCEDQHGLLALWLPVEHLPAEDHATTLRFLTFGGSFDEQDPDIGPRTLAALGVTADPDYTVDVTQGRLGARRLILALDGEGRGAAFRLPRADLPAALPVTVSNLNPNWTVALLDRVRRRWRPLGLLEETAYAVLDTTEDDKDVFIGHPVVADDPDLVLNLVQTGDREGILEIHNPTGRAVETGIRWTPAWEGMGRNVDVPRLAPGASHGLPVDFAWLENGRTS